MATSQLNLQAKSKSSETNLVLASQSGDERAFGQLYEVWAGKVYRFVYIKVKSVPVAEDLTSEIFLKAWQKIHQFKPKEGAKFSSWLYAIARNAVVDYYRVSSRREISFEDLPEMADLEGEEPYTEASELEAVLDKMPAEYAKVLRLRFAEEIPIARVAQIMKKKEANVRALTHRALKRLAEELKNK
ncbi:MAG: sigma-70 family RNA polymerase sigma factor [Patescibacteria group bacterium]|nr:sigma-70 family RNA polymerase sigma factor [Patescibacteria group bacterium]